MVNKDQWGYKDQKVIREIQAIWVLRDQSGRKGSKDRLAYKDRKATKEIPVIPDP
jgi:hypothetical protein